MNRQIVLLVVPLALIELVLAVVALVDWARRRAFRGLPRWGWLAVILFVEIVGPTLYLTLGRGEEHAGPDGRDSD